MINETEIKRLIFNIYDNVRVLFNDYYNGKDHYTKEDLQVIRGCIVDTKIMLEELKEETREVN